MVWLTLLYRKQLWKSTRKSVFTDLFSGIKSIRFARLPEGCRDKCEFFENLWKYYWFLQKKVLYLQSYGGINSRGCEARFGVNRRAADCRNLSDSFVRVHCILRGNFIFFRTGLAATNKIGRRNRKQNLFYSCCWRKIHPGYTAAEAGKEQYDKECLQFLCFLPVGMAGTPEHNSQ